MQFITGDVTSFISPGTRFFAGEDSARCARRRLSIGRPLAAILGEKRQALCIAGDTPQDRNTGGLLHVDLSLFVLDLLRERSALGSAR